MMRSMIIVAGLVSVVAMGACNRTPDVEEMANGALDRVQLSDVVDAKYDADARVVHLSGSVGRPEDRLRADDAVRASVEGLALVANEIVVEGAEADAADDLDSGIEERFDSMWANGPVDLRGYDVDIAAENGVVTITGTVSTAAEKARVEQLVQTIPGVDEVVNGLAVKPDARPVNPPVPQ